jgi:uncharacterized protein
MVRREDNRGRGAALRDELLAELAWLYGEIVAATAAISCDDSADCCDFGETGREPYLTPLEWQFLMQDASFQRVASSLRARAGEANASGRAHARKPLPVIADNTARVTPCPLLSAEGRCQVYQARPYGCRTYYCSRASERIDRKALAQFTQKIAELNERAVKAGLAKVAYGRPLRTLLANR